MLEEVSTKETKEPLMKEAPESLEKFDSAMKKISTNNKTVLKSSVKTLLSTLQNLQKKPTDPKNRKLRMENILIKKYISGVQGAQEFLEVVGYRVTEASSKKFLEIEQDALNQTLLGNAIDLLTEKLKTIESGDAPAASPTGTGGTGGTAGAGTSGPAPKPAVQKFCVGGCGFFGDEKTENMCSLCYRKKHGQAPAPKESKTVLCSKGCGFYGLDKFKGMCSVCYGKENLTRRKDLKRRWRMALTKIKAVRRFKLSLKPIQKNKTRCWKCNRKVGITGIECRCGYIFCGKDRYASEHDCPYDFKKAHQKKISQGKFKINREKNG